MLVRQGFVESLGDIQRKFAFKCTLYEYEFMQVGDIRRKNAFK